MNELELLANIAKLKGEYRDITAEYSDTSKDKADIEARLSAKMEELRNLEKQLAEMKAPKEPEQRKAEGDSIFNPDTWLKAEKENRTITINSTGAVRQIQDLFEKVEDKDEITSQLAVYYGENALTMIPVLMPTDDPIVLGEADTTATVDTSAALSACEIQPKEHMSIVPVSSNALRLGLVDLNTKLPDVFSKTFWKAIHKGVLVGSGSSNEIKGVFLSVGSADTDRNVIAADSEGTITVTELAQLAVMAAAKSEKYTIVMNPAVYGKILADSSTGEDIKIYKEGLIRDKKIEGVDVIIDAFAPNYASAKNDKAWVVAAPFGRYALGVAGEIVIDPIKVKGDPKTYFQASLFFSGKQVTDKDVLGIISAHA